MGIIRSVNSAIILEAAFRQFNTNLLATPTSNTSIGLFFCQAHLWLAATQCEQMGKQTEHHFEY